MLVMNIKHRNTQVDPETFVKLKARFGTHTAAAKALRTSYRNYIRWRQDCRVPPSVVSLIEHILKNGE
jgi:hypothetical protein